MSTKSSSKSQNSQQSGKLPPLTKWQKVKFSIYGIIFLAIIGLWIGWSVMNANQVNQAKDSGVRYTAVSNGEYSARESVRRRGSGVVYRAWYTFTDNDGVQRTVLGEKEYDSPDDIKSGVEVDAYFNTSGEGRMTYVEREP